MSRRAAAVAVAASLGLLASVGTAIAAVEDRQTARTPQVLIGNDDDDPSNPMIQPPGVTANQSLRKGDQLLSGSGHDVLIGRLGPDTLTSGDGDDVLVGGTERGSDVAAFPPFDVAYGGQGNDVFIWAPGDGSDAFLGGEPPRFRTVVRRRVVRRGGRRVVVRRRVRRRSRPDTDTLALGTLVLQPGDNTQPQLFGTDYGRLPRVFVSDRGLPATIGDSPPQPPVKGFCEIVPAPPGLGYQFLVRFFVEATGQQAVTIRTRGVEQVLCGTRDGDGITLTTLGRSGGGPAVVRSTDFRPREGTKLDALVD